VQPLAEFNLGHTRFADGVAIYKKGPEKTSERGHAALAAGAAAIREGEAALAEEQVDKVVASYRAGQGARRELRAAEKAVKLALEIFGKTLTKWRRAADDFHGAAELNPADASARHNAEFVEQEIAKLVDSIRMMQALAGQLAGQKDQLGKMLSKLKGQIPAADAPPGGQGEGDEEENGSGKGEVKPESLAGKEEGTGRDGEPTPGQLAPDLAGQILDGLPVDGSKRNW
jgi:hypothetical protein